MAKPMSHAERPAPNCGRADGTDEADQEDTDARNKSAHDGKVPLTHLRVPRSRDKLELF